ncbi:MAG TPA: sulfite exporter TauE/SafE family protein [Polyangia bacterium]|nr:sulfite exporter TauE/SafE family protein [Polyangia bacterium]
MGLSGRGVLFALLAVVGAAFVAAWAREAKRARAPGAPVWPTPLHLVIGFVTDFLDTLGIGSFASTTSMFKLGRVVDDEDIPGTLNVGHSVPTFAEAIIFILVVDVEMTTLLTMIAAAVAGAWLGAGVVSSWSRRRVQLGMGVLLIVAAAIIVLRLTKTIPGGGDALGLSGARLVAGLVGNFILGALMTLGIGLYAPCMILVSFLGMNDVTAFPIMMGSCAFLMPAAGIRFIRSGRYDLRASLGLTLAGTPAAILAGLVVKSLPLGVVKWLVVGVVVYTAVAMLRSSRASAPGKVMEPDAR